ncbi:TRAP-type C4-dicarboxylate transport system substrate-binding protein [Herbaspirillum rubrisubalbicans]|uniref:TRAP transporter substrate-binding protein DctP n=1 Tax=Herbaspirillum rubrisubalbicans TaxID=80842 RepID=UPI00209FECF4|nr:TRAP transporter substrate-binding protein DctP [Herbaspirillum rubrisubalbicans]MCP1573091.1 TRAP-type C4-dicarboxylate transport system substrate-binding protein [Herbaspirillum rubrisubalbicans]
MKTMTRRHFLGALAAAPLASAVPSVWAQSATLKISHQFPGGTITEGDFRDRLVRTFAQQVSERTKGALKFEIYPGSSLMKTNAQFSALRKGALDMSLVPLNYAGGEVPETNIGLMPGLVTSYQQGASWKNAEVGKELARVLGEKGVVIVSWIWQAGGVASRGKPIVDPADVKGMKVRGGSREMDLILKEAGAAVVTLPSNEIYAAMQTGAMDAAMTSSTSFMSFRLEEVAKALTTGRDKAYWYMFEPLMMSKAVFERLPKDQQAIIMAVGTEMEQFATKAAQADDIAVAQVYQKAGAKVVDLNAEVVKKWQDIARNTAWKDFAGRNASCAKLLALAEKTL